MIDQMTTQVEVGQVFGKHMHDLTNNGELIKFNQTCKVLRKLPKSLSYLTMAEKDNKGENNVPC